MHYKVKLLLKTKNVLGAEVIKENARFLIISLNNL